MSSPGAYLTSIQPGVWYRLSDREWIFPMFVNATITANTNYGPFTAPQPLQTFTLVILTVTSVSGTSPTLTVNWTVYDLVAATNGVYEGGISGSWFSNISAPGTYSAGSYSTNGTYTYYGAFMVSVVVGGTSPSFTATLTMYILI